MKYLKKFEFSIYGEYWRIIGDENIKIYLNKIGVPKNSSTYSDLVLFSKDFKKDQNIYVWHIDKTDEWGYTYFVGNVKGKFKKYNGVVKLTKFDLDVNKYNL